MALLEEIIEAEVKQLYGSWKNFEIDVERRQTNSLKTKLFLNIQKINVYFSKLEMHIRLEKNTTPQDYIVLKEIINTQVKKIFGSWKQFEVEAENRRTNNLKTKMFFNTQKVAKYLSKLGLIIKLEKEDSRQDHIENARRFYELLSENRAKIEYQEENLSYDERKLLLFYQKIQEIFEKLNIFGELEVDEFVNEKM